MRLRRRVRAAQGVGPPRDAWEALARCVELPRFWVAAVAIATVASTVHVRFGDGPTTIEFRVTTVTALLAALLWLPTLLRVIALTGGNLKTPAGEATTGGFLKHFRQLPPDQQEESLSAAAAVVDRFEVDAPPEERSRARQVREELEEAIGEIPRPPKVTTKRLREIASEYERLRAQVPSGPERTRAMTELMTRARGLASSRAQRSDPTADPRRWFNQDSDGARIVALAAAQARQDPRDLSIVIDAISNPRSAFEQFHALRAAADLLPQLDGQQLRALRQSVEGQLARNEGGGRWITRADQSRWRLAHAILQRIQEISQES